MFLDRFFKFFTSLRLTVACLAIGLVLVFVGTLAQVELGLYKAQNEFFRSFFIYWGPKGASWKIPVFPGGYLVGAVLLINLVAAHFSRFTFSKKKIGIWMVHLGLILLLLGQLLSDLLSRESSLHLREGETKNYSETQREAELAVIDVTEETTDKVVAIPQRLLATEKEIRHQELPFVIRVKDFLPNSHVEERGSASTEPPVATEGIGARATLRRLPKVTVMDERDVPSAVVEILAGQTSLGTWLFSEWISKAQSLTWNNRKFEVSQRSRRHYKPFSIKLLNFTHEVYKGTEIPKNFSSRVFLHRPNTGEKREVLIYMNSPLRYAGETYYQASFDADDKGSILQVVHNPSWLTPYVSCIMVGLGLLVQFFSHLIPFLKRRITA
jgi:hypothetical protein